MGKRLRKTLYAGNLSDLDEPPDHPPIALTGLALELFTKAVPNDGLDILDMDYVSCASEAARVSPCAMIVAMIYLERLQLKNSEYLEIVSPSGLFVVTMLVASKFLFEDEDDVVTNQMWADALNFDVKELNNLERDFLAAIDWKVLVDSSDYFNYLCKIEKIIATRQSSLRNWLSYSDICSMLHDKAFETFWAPCFKRIMKAMVLWTVGYVATALTLHNASFAIHKLLEGKHELKNLSEINSTSELQNHVQSIDKPFNNNLIEGSNTEFLKLPLSFETLTEQESENMEMVQGYGNGIYTYEINHNMCDKSNPERISFKSNKSRLQILENLKTTLTSHALTRELILVNDSYGNCGTRCRQNTNCFSLLM
nr:protein CNPPD1 isoform X2 [Parasteatoda tepidariorum]